MAEVNERERDAERREMERRVKDLEDRSNSGEIVDSAAVNAAGAEVSRLEQQGTFTRDEAQKYRKRIDAAKEWERQMRNEQSVRTDSFMNSHERSRVAFEMENLQARMNRERGGAAAGASGSGKMDRGLEK